VIIRRTGIELNAIDASDALTNNIPLFSKKKYKVTPVSPAANNMGIFFRHNFSDGASFCFIGKRKIKAIANLNIASDVGGNTTTVIFVDIKEKPQNKMQPAIAARAFPFVVNSLLLILYLY
jgi:hypothetical protein